MSNLARDYDQWYTESSRSAGADEGELKVCDWVLDLLAAKTGRSLLDVACGPGTLLTRAKSRGLEVSGIDVSPVAVETARRRLPDVDVQVGRGEELPYGDETFDYVTCIGSLEHFPDPEAGAAEIRRVLRQDGRALIYVPNLFFLGHVYLGLRRGTQPSEGEQQFSERFLSSEGWRDLLHGSGLQVESWHPWNHIWATTKVSRPTIAAWNMFARLLPRNAAYSFAFVCRR
jgi:SAM-dependent methyltransferase